MYHDCETAEMLHREIKLQKPHSAGYVAYEEPRLQPSSLSVASLRFLKVTVNSPTQWQESKSSTT